MPVQYKFRGEKATTRVSLLPPSSWLTFSCGDAVWGFRSVQCSIRLAGLPEPAKSHDAADSALIHWLSLPVAPLFLPLVLPAPCASAFCEGSCPTCTTCRQGKGGKGGKSHNQFANPDLIKNVNRSGISVSRVGVQPCRGYSNNLSPPVSS